MSGDGSDGIGITQRELLMEMGPSILRQVATHEAPTFTERRGDGNG